MPREVSVPGCVLRTELLELPCLSGALGGELADRFEHPEPRFAELIATLDQCLVEERLQRVGVPIGHLLDGGKGRAPREHAEASEQLPFLVREERGSTRSCSERALARIGVAVSGRDVEPGRESIEQLLDREQTEPCSRELQREREPVEATDQGRQRGGGPSDDPVARARARNNVSASSCVITDVVIRSPASWRRGS